MRISERHELVLDLRDGKERDYHWLRDNDGIQLTVIAPDEVLYVLFAQADQEGLRRALQATPCPATDLSPRAAPCVHGANGRLAWIDQRHVTTVSLRGRRAYELQWRIEPTHARLSIVSAQEVIHLDLPAADAAKLAAEWLPPSDVATLRDEATTPLSLTLSVLPRASFVAQLAPLEWLAYN